MEGPLLSSIWPELGFRASPYGAEHLQATQEGNRLLVGRDAEIAAVLRLLRSTSRHVTIEGDNGVGKTSLVNVACFRALREFEEGRTRQLLIPLTHTFQLNPGASIEDFRREVFFEVARAFIAMRETIAKSERPVPDTANIDRWLNAPILGGGGGGISIMGIGGSVSTTQSANSSAGFTEVGFTSAVTAWLRQAFPSADYGGFVVVIDNLELLETSQAARALLEGLRDTVLNQPGLRWILCGARGIIRTSASSPRLEGVLSEPIEVEPLPDAAAPDLIARRIEAFRTTMDAVAPVDAEGFKFVYDVLHSNLRNSLRYCEDFSLWLAGQVKPSPTSEVARREQLRRWLTELANRYLSDTTSVGGRAWQVFDDLVQKMSGSCSPSDHREFGYDTPQAMRPQVKSLEDAQLVLSTKDDIDQRRKTVGVTPRGWLVSYARALRRKSTSGNSSAGSGPERSSTSS